jgi:hypothetical protein
MRQLLDDPKKKEQQRIYPPTASCQGTSFEKKIGNQAAPDFPEPGAQIVAVQLSEHYPLPITEILRLTISHRFLDRRQFNAKTKTALIARAKKEPASGSSGILLSDTR